ncbi:hypothetical protein PSI23_20295 [Xenorhabdus sp. XENO-10]|uniref:Uncharacterized protein n=1 Tax=Xenorhabdus yunnanensis TaxID=3025878 RepID=A0ABT5LM82_9GAMM|nr:hypothetical protein [Xenorhabdus yunnanensis]MDC9591556.1 hypothetical protein [Xenorhabdus yunnanensis]
MPIEYAVTGNHILDDPTDRYTLENPEWDRSYPKYLAEECAKDYWSDGWEGMGRPIEITVFDDDESIGTFYIEIEFEPIFSATRRNDDH